MGAKRGLNKKKIKQRDKDEQQGGPNGETHSPPPAAAVAAPRTRRALHAFEHRGKDINERRLLLYFYFLLFFITRGPRGPPYVQIS